MRIEGVIIVSWAHICGPSMCCTLGVQQVYYLSSHTPHVSTKEFKQREMNYMYDVQYTVKRVLIA